MRLPRERFDYSPIVGPPALEAAPGRPHRGLDHRQRRGVGHREADAARRTCRRRRASATRARRAELGLARLRDARRLLAAPRRARRSARSARPRRSTRTSAASYAPVARAMLDAGWEFMGHGVVQGAMHLVPDQRDGHPRRPSRSIRDVHRQDAARAGSVPGSPRRGRRSTSWPRRGSSTSSDWVNDDQPYEIQTSAGPLVSVPYTLELNDIPMMLIQHHESSELARARARPVRPALRRGREERRASWRSPCTPTSRACRTGSSTSRRSTTTSDSSKGVWLTTGEEIYEWFKRGR